jgi:son of sevenless-like protein
MSLPNDTYVRALYDYQDDDRTILSFRKGDVIQVIATLKSGWWDGLLHEERGWFPSNYCVLITRREAHAAGNATEMQQASERVPLFSR